LRRTARAHAGPAHRQGSRQIEAAGCRRAARSGWPAPHTRTRTRPAWRLGGCPGRGLTDMNHRTFAIGIVGAGRVFEQHARACAELGARARLLAIADVDDGQVRKATSRHFIPFAYRDYRSLLDREDIAVVAVCTPPASHERIVVDALDAGKFVICEKPLAHTLQAADRIIAAASRAPGKLSTVFQFRYLPEMRRTRWLLDNGHLGRLLFGRFSRYARFDTAAKPLKPGKAPKAGKERADWWGRWGIAGGGVVMTQ